MGASDEEAEQPGDFAGEDEPVMKPMRSPQEPTDAEIEKHVACGHLPYRSWCSHCVRGRGTGRAHYESKADIWYSTPTVSTDYMYLGGEDEDSLPILAKVHHATKWRTARVVPSKGPVEEVVAKEAAEISRWGLSRFIYKSDGEPALVALKRAVRQRLSAEADEPSRAATEIMLEESPVGDHKANGVIERAVLSIGGQVRTLKLAVEGSFNIKLPPHSPIMHWLIPWAAFVLSRFEVGVDGRTPYERARGKSFRMATPTFGETVFFKPIPTKTGKRQNKMDARWEEGIFLGVREEQFEYWVATPGTEPEIHRSGDIKRKPPSQRYNTEALLKIKCTPISFEGEESKLEKPVVVFAAPDVTVPPLTAQTPAAPNRRKLYIRKEELRQFGWTRGCPRCEAEMIGAPAKHAHSDVCRERIAAEMAKTPEGQLRLKMLDERLAQEPTEVDAETSGKRGPEEEGQESQHKRARGGDAEAPAPAGSYPTMQVGGSSSSGSQQHPTAASTETGRAEQSAPAASSAEPSLLDKILRAVERNTSTKRKAEAEAPESASSSSSQVQDMRDVNSMELDVNAVHLGVEGHCIAELYGPGRICSLSETLGYSGGQAFDLRCTDPDDGEPWDLSLESKRKKVEWLIEDIRPTLVIGSPPCKFASLLQNVNWAKMDATKRDELIRSGISHLRFCFVIYARQVKRGAYFLHEHPWGAWSWLVDFVQLFMNQPGIYVGRGDQCPFGQWTVDEQGPALVQKGTGWMSNSWFIVHRVAVQCSNKGPNNMAKHRHGHLISGRASACEEYPPALEAAIVNGLTDQLRYDGLLVPGQIGLLSPEHEEIAGRAEESAPAAVQALTETDDLHEDSVRPQFESDGETFVDTVTGVRLDPNLVRAARQKELETIREFKVYVKVPISEAYSTTGKPPIGCKWVDTNKGDAQRPNYRSRLVAKEFRFQDPGKEDTFAATPPLEALRLLVSFIMTEPDDPKDKAIRGTWKILFMDATRAHFHSPCREDIYVRLCAEDDEPGMCAKLVMSMYGTRAAATNWEYFSRSVMVNLGFTPGKYSPCLFLHEQRRLRAFIHGDDFVLAGTDQHLLWFEVEAKKHILLKRVAFFGPDPIDDKEMRVLNRILHWDVETDAIEWEGDPRHSDITISQMGLSQGSKGVSTPGVDVRSTGGKPLDRQQTTLYRSVTMRTSYQALDRPELLFSSKEAARKMQVPDTESMEKLKRIARFLITVPRLVQVFARQGRQHRLDQHSDTDHAGCKQTRRSTSAGITMHGSHAISAYSYTQKVVSTSSGESEFYGMFRASSRVIGLKTMCEDFGLKREAHLWADASAGIGIANRRGVGKVKHLHTQALWLQERVGNKEVFLHKERGTENPADLPTKHVDSKTMWRCLTFMGFEARQGKRQMALDIAS